MMSKERIPLGSRLTKPTNTQLPSGSCTNGAANRSGSARNGRARETSHGPVSDSPGIDHVQCSPQRSIVSGICSCQWHVNARTGFPSISTGCATSIWPKPAGSERGGSSSHVTKSWLRAWAMTPSSRRGAPGLRAQMFMCQPSPSGSRNTNGSRQVSLARGSSSRPSVMYQRGSASSSGALPTRRQVNRSSDSARPIFWLFTPSPAELMAV